MDHWRHGLTGHLFEGRFKSTLVETDAHFLQACRYIVRNPVRAAICDTAREYRWSSYRATAGSVPRPASLSVDRLAASLGGIDAGLYRAFVDAGTEEAIRRRVGRVDPVTPAMAA